MIYSSQSYTGGEHVIGMDPSNTIQTQQENFNTVKKNSYDSNVSHGFFRSENNSTSDNDSGDLFDPEIPEEMEEERFPLSTKKEPEEFLYLDIPMSTLEELKTSPGPLEISIAAYRMNYSFGKKNPFIEYFILENSFPKIQLSVPKDNEINLKNEIMKLMKEKEGTIGINEPHVITDMIKGYYTWSDEKKPDKEMKIVFVHWNFTEQKYSNSWKTISEIVHLPEISDFFDSVPKIKNIYRQDDNYSILLQPIFLYGHPHFLRSIDDIFGNFYQFIESKEPKGDMTSKYLVRIPEPEQTLFLIRSPINQLDTEIIKNKYTDKIIYSKACMFYQDNHNVWIIKDPTCIYPLDPTIPKSFSSNFSNSIRNSSGKTLSLQSTGSGIFDLLKK